MATVQAKWYSGKSYRDPGAFNWGSYVNPASFYQTQFNNPGQFSWGEYTDPGKYNWENNAEIGPAPELFGGDAEARTLANYDLQNQLRAVQMQRAQTDAQFGKQYSDMAQANNAALTGSQRNASQVNAQLAGAQMGRGMGYGASAAANIAQRHQMASQEQAGIQGEYLRNMQNAQQQQAAQEYAYGLANLDAQDKAGAAYMQYLRDIYSSNVQGYQADVTRYGYDVSAESQRNQALMDWQMNAANQQNAWNQAMYTGQNQWNMGSAEMQNAWNQNLMNQRNQYNLQTADSRNQFNQSQWTNKNQYQLGSAGAYNDYWSQYRAQLNDQRMGNAQLRAAGSGGGGGGGGGGAVAGGGGGGGSKATDPGTYGSVASNSAARTGTAPIYPWQTSWTPYNQPTQNSGRTPLTYVTR